MKTYDLMHYKDYYGSYHLDIEAKVFYGKLEFIKALITYEASTAKGLQKAFVEAVDDYLAMCEQEGIEPERPFKGSFNVRVGEELHRKAALAAASAGITLNQFICETLEELTTKKTGTYS
jgi:predicted HicB family RNase H-like nuclease